MNDNDSITLNNTTTGSTTTTTSCLYNCCPHKLPCGYCKLLDKMCPNYWYQPNWYDPYHYQITCKTSSN